MVNIAVLVSGGGTNLQALIDKKRLYEQNGRIRLVVSGKRDAYALERARAAGIETAVLQKSDFSGNRRYGEALVELLRSRDIGLVVLAGFLTVLDKCVIDAYPDKIINVHPSLIPAFCGDGYYGLRVHSEALKRGVKITGATVHFVNEVTDGGRIIFQKAVEVKEGDTPEELAKRVLIEAEWQLLPAAVADICSGKIR